MNGHCWIGYVDEIFVDERKSISAQHRKWQMVEGVVRVNGSNAWYLMLSFSNQIRL
jgi:hypothetical protein